MAQKADSMKHPFRYGQLPPDRAARVGISAPNGFGRKFGERQFATPKLAPGMHSRTTGSQSAFHHGVALQDEPLATKVSQTGSNVPIHDGMTDQQRGKCVTCPSGNAVLGDSGSHSWRQAVGTKHGSHAPIGALPSKLIGK
jgi:hypothetical protein